MALDSKTIIFLPKKTKTTKQTKTDLDKMARPKLQHVNWMSFTCLMQHKSLENEQQHKNVIARCAYYRNATLYIPHSHFSLLMRFSSPQFAHGLFNPKTEQVPIEGYC